MQPPRSSRSNHPRLVIPASPSPTIPDITSPEDAEFSSPIVHPAHFGWFSNIQSRSHSEANSENGTDEASNHAGLGLGLPMFESPMAQPLSFPEGDVQSEEAAADEQVLVRTAQASRLRRRGAIRLDGAFTGVPNPREYWNVSSVNLPYDAYAHDRALRCSLTEESWRGQTNLYCGGVDDTFSASTSLSVSHWTRLASPNPLPQALPAPLTYSQRHPQRSSLRHPPRSNGCDALLHSRASTTSDDWVALGDSSLVVGVLPEEYCSSSDKSVVYGKRRCGCVVELLACKSCGNRLGRRLTPCTHHAPMPPPSVTNHYPFPVPVYTFERSQTHTALSRPPTPPPAPRRPIPSQILPRHLSSTPQTPSAPRIRPASTRPLSRRSESPPIPSTSRNTNPGAPLPSGVLSPKPSRESMHMQQ